MACHAEISTRCWGELLKAIGDTASSSLSLQVVRAVVFLQPAVNCTLYFVIGVYSVVVSVLYTLYYGVHIRRCTCAVFALATSLGRARPEGVDHRAQRAAVLAQQRERRRAPRGGGEVPRLPRASAFL